MRKLVALVLFVMLLWGCTASPIPGGEMVGGRQALWQLPVEIPEGLSLTGLCDADDALLLCGRNGNDLTLQLLSQKDLTVTSSATLTAGARSRVQVLDECVSIADPEAQTVTLLTPSLEPLTVLELYIPADAWFLSPDAGTLYAISGNALLSRPLPTGELENFPDRRRYSLMASTQPRTLLEGVRLSLVSMTADRAFLVCMGSEGDLMTRWYALDLGTGTVAELEDSRMIAMVEGLQPLSDGSYLDRDSRELTLYGSDGSFLGQCSLPDSDNGYCGRDLIYSEEQQGWFFLDYPDGNGRLMFWYPVPGVRGDGIDLAPETVPEGSVLPRELYDRAEELSERFDLDIRIGDRCIRGYSSYDSGMLTDPELTSHALDVLEEVLGQYPEGFFTQLKYSNRHTVRIELVDGLSAKAGKDVSSGTSAVTFRLDRCCLIALNAHRIRPSAIFHEFSHIIDDRMRWEAMFREDALYSEEGWLALQPEGFEYAGSYQKIPDSVRQFYDSGWFATNYGCVSATEDRAVTMEHACTGEKSLFTGSPHLMAKLEYYCACIRDSFDTEGWPDVTPWEQFLE